MDDASPRGELPREWTLPQVRTLALRILTRTELTRSDLNARLTRRGIAPELCDEVLDQLERARMVDDATYARLWVDSRHHSKGLPRVTLARELRRKGVDEAIVEAALADIDGDSELEAARAQLARRLPSVSGLPRETQHRRLVAFLGRKGYPPSLCVRLVGEALAAYSG
jgi:regulatory protein